MRNGKKIAGALYVAMGVLGILVLTAYARTVATGKFTALAIDTTTPRTVNTGLTHIRVLRIYVYDPKRPAEIAYTTDQIQGDRPGVFLCQTRWLSGVSMDSRSGSFTLTHAMFSRPGVTYYWEALGD